MLGPSTPTFDYLPRQITHSVYVYNQSLTSASESRHFGSVVRALDFQPGGPGSIPTKGMTFFQLCFIPLLRLSCRKNTFTENFPIQKYFNISFIVGSESF